MLCEGCVCGWSEFKGPLRVVVGVGWEWGVKDVCCYVQCVSRIRRANVNQLVRELKC